jgi:hypothetical protein
MPAIITTVDQQLVGYEEWKQYRQELAAMRSQINLQMDHSDELDGSLSEKPEQTPRFTLSATMRFETLDGWDSVTTDLLLTSSLDDVVKYIADHPLISGWRYECRAADGFVVIPANWS